MVAHSVSNKHSASEAIQMPNTRACNLYAHRSAHPQDTLTKMLLSFHAVTQSAYTGTKFTAHLLTASSCKTWPQYEAGGVLS